jgi:hypothetical protein
MRMLLAIGGAGAVAGYAIVYFALGARLTPTPTPDAQPAPPAVAEVAEPLAPEVLAQVVDVTDIDALLDPAPSRPTGVPFDPDPPAFIHSSPVATPIPPAVD